MSPAPRHLLPRARPADDPFARFEQDERALRTFLKLALAVAATLAILALSARLIG